jgi:starch synthase (maltosyl-transferring)
MELQVELAAGRELLELGLKGAAGPQHEELENALKALSPESGSTPTDPVQVALSPGLADVMDACSERLHAVVHTPNLRVLVDPVLARFGAWYELFPRSCAAEPGRHGTFADCAAWLPRIAAMGFDVVYLPPVHPIGRTFRKGKNSRLELKPGDPGSPWAIGSEDGGHKAVHPELGTLEAFRELVRRARSLQLEIALDIAFQCSPDHPYVREHPQWFRHRPDGSIQYAENPPKKYQDIYPLDFETEDWRSLWEELKSLFEFWIEQGVRIFRVDNPHTKPFRFWEWCLGELRRDHSELIFLSEAFTRPAVMYYLAKLGFTQSYNYFPWRNTKHELTTDLTALTHTSLREFFRPNLWLNTPDILTEYLQFGGRPAFVARLILAATLGASYGIYGPPFEVCEHTPREAGTEEYLNSEKYEIRHWDFSADQPMQHLLTRLNQIRRENPPLQRNESLQFHAVDNEQLLAYSKHDDSLGHVILVIVNLDPRHTQRGWVSVDLEKLGLTSVATYQAHELLTGERYLWSGARNFVELNPAFVPAHVLRLRRHVRSERDFDYFL